MSMRLLTAAVAAATLLGASAALRADEAPKTYMLRLHEKWEVGQMTTRTSTKTEKSKVVVTAGEQVVQEQEKSSVQTLRLVQKIVSIDEQGRATKSLVYFATWNSRKDEADDTSLEGVHVEVTGVGADRTWALKTPGKEPSEAAKKYLDDHWGKEEHDSERAMEPQKELAIGESWSPDLGAIATSMAEHFAIDLDKSKATGTLTGVEKDLAVFQLDFSLQTKALKTPQGEMEWKEGGMLSMKGSGRHTLAATGSMGMGTMQFSLSGVAVAGEALVSLEVSGTDESEAKAGGEMPPVPETPK